MNKYRGAVQFRQKIILSILSSKPVLITDIRADEDNPGLKDYEASFLRLIEKITNGTKIVINISGTAVSFKPGIITGGQELVHDCGTSRAIGYFLQPLIYLAPFSKLPFSVTLNGITNDEQDLSVDIIRAVTLPFLRHFGIEDGLELKITKRGAQPLGGGQVILKVPVMKQLKPIQLIDCGHIQKIRGICYVTRVAPTIANRIIEGCRSILNQFTDDLYIYNDHYKGADSGLSPGYGLALMAESSTGMIISAEVNGAAGDLPEDIGKNAGNLLLEEILNGGCIDSSNQGLPLLFMVLGPEDVSKIRIGKLTQFTINFLQLIDDFFGVRFKIENDTETDTIILTCLGIGFKNISKKMY